MIRSAALNNQAIILQYLQGSWFVLLGNHQNRGCDENTAAQKKLSLEFMKDPFRLQE